MLFQLTDGAVFYDGVDCADRIGLVWRMMDQFFAVARWGHSGR